MTLLLSLPVPLWLVGVGYLAGVLTLPALISAVWLWDARKARLRAEEEGE